MIGIFGHWNHHPSPPPPPPIFTSRISIFVKFLETCTPVFTSRMLISAKLILFSRYLGGNLYTFASEASPMLYGNAWYFWRMEHPFLLPEYLFLRH